MRSNVYFSLHLSMWIVLTIFLFSFSCYNYLIKIPLMVAVTTTPPSKPPGKRSSCEVLLSEGSAVCQEDNQRILNCSASEKIWEPGGCDLYIHTFSDLGNCISKLEHKRIYMMGDSRIRHIYESFKSRLKGLEYSRNMQLWQDMIYKNKKKGLSLKFFWQPFLNNETLQILTELNGMKKRPTLLFLGNALHTIWKFNGSEESYFSYKENFGKMVQILGKLTSRTKVVWMIQPPVIHPFSDTDNFILNQYNDVAFQQLNGSNIRGMHNAKRIGESMLDAYVDGVHLGEEANKMIVEILLNYMCNAYVSIEENICCDKKSKMNF